MVPAPDCVGGRFSKVVQTSISLATFSSSSWSIPNVPKLDVLWCIILLLNSASNWVNCTQPYRHPVIRPACISFKCNVCLWLWLCMRVNAERSSSKRNPLNWKVGNPEVVLLEYLTPWPFYWWCCKLTNCSKTSISTFIHVNLEFQLTIQPQPPPTTNGMNQ